MTNSGPIATETPFSYNSDCEVNPYGFKAAPPRDISIDSTPGDSITSIWWAFGPQGHPASMSVTLYITDEETSLSIIRNARDVIPYENHTKDIAVHLTKVLKIGQMVDDCFKKDYRWWACSDNCDGMIFSNDPPYRQCPDCMHIREIETEKAKSFWKRFV